MKGQERHPDSGHPVTLSPSHPVIFLVGPRGSGKTTVARLLAARLGWDWVDADARLEELSGRSVRDIFMSEGETAFRDRESAVLAELCGSTRHVVATGGGVVLRPENRARLRAAGQVVWLTADAETLSDRLLRDETTADRRPALTGTASASSVDEIVQVLRRAKPFTASVPILSPRRRAGRPTQLWRNC